ncbi:S26 family signal peptidase [Streptomyces lydicus]|uniref:S26 family signal peptidase n=1 Tax=Streptomyces lydicus TaxID=47763 RepID=UPI003790D31B
MSAGASAGILAAALLPAGAAAALLRHRFIVVTVRGMSMAPSYRDGDRVLVYRTTRPARGRVLVVEQPPARNRWPKPPLPRRAGPGKAGGRHWLIKRVAALPGDPVPQPLLRATAPPRPGPVPQGHLVLLGDNPEHSVDSRHFGFYPSERVLGAVVKPLRTPTRPPPRRTAP